MYARCTRTTASGCEVFNSSKQRCGPTDSCSSEPIAPSAMRMAFFKRALKSSILIGNVNETVYRESSANWSASGRRNGQVETWYIQQARPNRARKGQHPQLSG